MVKGAPNFFPFRQKGDQNVLMRERGDHFFSSGQRGARRNCPPAITNRQPSFPVKMPTTELDQITLIIVFLMPMQFQSNFVHCL